MNVYIYIYYIYVYYVSIQLGISWNFIIPSDERGRSTTNQTLLCHSFRNGMMGFDRFFSGKWDGCVYWLN